MPNLPFPYFHPITFNCISTLHATCSILSLVISFPLPAINYCLAHVLSQSLISYLFPYSNTSNLIIVFIQIYLNSKIKSNKRIWQELWKSKMPKFQTYIPLMLCLGIPLCWDICIPSSNCNSWVRPCCRFMPN